MFCGKCGSPFNGKNFCVSCGSAAAAQLPTPIRPTVSKNKNTAVLLSVFLGFWSFLYSYRIDKKKFWFWLAYSSTVLISLAVFVVALSKYSYSLPDLYSFTRYFGDVIAGAPLSSGGNHWVKPFFYLANWSFVAAAVLALTSWATAVITAVKRPESFFQKL